MKIRSCKGFTLVELLVVIAIIGLLSSIVVVIFLDRGESARQVKIRADIVQIMKAAEIVYSTYGYYPNDSHGSIICPRDIIIDEGTGKKWGDIINLCEDPYGNPYEWDNKCTNGETRHPTIPNPGCDSYSSADQGEYGVVMAGENGINDVCSGDDLCFGQAGHSLYGWATGDGGSPPPPDASCTTQVGSCSGLTIVQCPDRTGCSLSSSSCSGTYDTSCSIYNADQTSCQGTTGCTWNTSASCGGTPNACSSYPEQTSCEGAGCTFGTTSSCGGTALACSTWNGNQSVCLSQSGCSYSAGPAKCNGTHNTCNTYLGESTCNANLSCSWSSSSSCTGAPSACTSYGSEPSCSSVGCTWSTGTSCSGTFSSSCSVYNADQTSCQGTAGCAWNAQTCTGLASSCTTYSDQISCNSEAGCLWQ